MCIIVNVACFANACNFSLKNEPKTATGSSHFFSQRMVANKNSAAVIKALGEKYPGISPPSRHVIHNLD
jgi:hypothetical protein